MSFTKKHGARQLRTTDDGSRTLFDPEAAESYHSDRGAVTESRHVFLEGSGVADRLRQGDTVQVLEVGLGTGLNLLLTLDAVLTSVATVHYRALESSPPHPDLVAELALGDHLVNPSLADAWLEIARDLHQRNGTVGSRSPGVCSQLLSYPLPGPHGRHGSLEVALGDAAAGPDCAPSGVAMAALEPGWADAIYHDAFSIAASPRLWSSAFLTACAEALRPGGAWVSYSVAGAVRRRLAGAGLSVEKRPGPAGGKREMLWAGKPSTPHTP